MAVFSSKFMCDFIVLMKSFFLIFSVVEPPVMTPSSTRHMVGSKSQPVSVLPSKRETGSALTAAQSKGLRAKRRASRRMVEMRDEARRLEGALARCHA